MANETTIQLDEEVRELLLEVATDPKSTLFGVTPAQVVTSARLDMPTVSAGTAGWTAAERHLLAGYREAVAEALVPVLLDQVQGERATSEFLNGPKQPLKPDPVPRARVLTESRRYPNLDPTACAVLEAISRGGARPSSVALATVIYKLRPDHSSVLLEGIARIEGDPGAAVRILRGLYEDSNRRLIRYYASVNLGLAVSKIGPLRDTLKPYAAAVREEPRAAALASLAINSFIEGERKTGAVASAYLEDAIDPQEARFLQLCSVYRTKQWSGPEKSALSEWRTVAGPTMGKVLDAILD